MLSFAQGLKYLDWEKYERNKVLLFFEQQGKPVM
jgi:hypothetical protein